MIRKRNFETQLNELYDRKSKGAKIRSRAKWISEGGKNTKYFQVQEKKTPNTKRNLQTTEWKT